MISQLELFVEKFVGEKVISPIVFFPETVVVPVELVLPVEELVVVPRALRAVFAFSRRELRIYFSHEVRVVLF